MTIKMFRDPFQIVDLSYLTKVDGNIYHQHYLGVVAVPSLFVLADHEKWSHEMTAANYAAWTLNADPLFACQAQP